MSHATPAPATTPAPAPESNRFDLLELDLPAESSPLAAVLAAIAAIFVGTTRATAELALAALIRAIEPVKAWSEGPDKAAVRAAKDAKHAEIKRVFAMHPVPATERQAMPVIQASPPVPLASMMPAAPVATPRVLRGTWARIRTGAHSGTWGALVEGVTNPQPGERIRVFRANGTESQPMQVAEVVTDTARGVLVAVAEIPVAAPVAAPMAQGTAPIAAPVVEPEVAPTTEPTPSGDGGTIEHALGMIAAQGAVQTGAALGSMAEGARRGVGFSDAASYLTALQRGGLQPHTRAEYLARVRSAGLTFDESTLPPANVVDTTPAGKGIEHKVIGKSWNEMTRAERQQLLRVSGETRAKVTALLNEGQLIAGAVAAGSMLQVSWVGGGTTTVAKVRAAFEAAGIGYDAPTGPSAERHAGRAVDSLKSRGMDTTRLPSNDLPTGISARWLVGHKLTGTAIKAGDAYGRAALVVSLTDGNDLTFDGDTQLAMVCKAHFVNATAHEVLRSEDLTAWFAGILRKQLHAVKRGHIWYVPAGCADEARAVSETLETLWGDHERIPVTTGKDLARSLTRGLADELDKLAKTFATDTEAAKERAATKAAKDERTACETRNQRSARMRGPVLGEEAINLACDQAADKARERATCSPVVAARHMVELATIAARVDGYRTVLGDDATKDLAVRIEALRNQIEPLCTEGAQRAALLELA